MSELAGYVGAFYIRSDTAVDSDAYTDVVGEAVGIGDGVTLTFTLDNRNVDHENLTVQISDGALTTQRYGPDYYITPNGKVVFTSAPASDVTITADYRHFPNMIQAGGFFNWSVDVTGDPLDATSFNNSDGWRKMVPGLKGWSGSAERHWLDSWALRLFEDRTSPRVILRFYLDETNSDWYQGWGLLSGISTGNAVDTLVDESLSFAGSMVFKNQG